LANKICTSSFFRICLFLCFFLALQVIPLIGEQGLLPADNYLEAIESRTGFFQLPTLFWLHISDNWLLFFAWAGVLLSLIILFGYSNGFLLILLWFLYMSFVHIGQL